MLLDDEKVAGEETGAKKAPTAPSDRSRGLVFVLILVALGVGAWYAFQHAGGGDTGGINGGSAPPPTIFKVKPGATVPPAEKDWAVCANPGYEYWFRYPTKWSLSIPDEYDRGRSRYLASPDGKVHIVIIPFGLYDQDKKTEMDKAENTYLGDHTVKADKLVKVNGRDAYRRSYVSRVPTAAGFEETLVEGSMIEARPKGYLTFMWGPESDMKAALPTYERIVASFHVEKLPLENAGVVPPGEGTPAASGAPAGSPAASPAGSPAASPAPVSSGAPAPVPAASGAPAPSSVPGAH